MRKEIITWLLLLMLSFGLLACQYERLSPDQLPAAAQDYLTQRYPDAEIRRVKRDRDGDEAYCYEVLLSNDREVYFDCAGGFLFEE